MPVRCDCVDAGDRLGGVTVIVILKIVEHTFFFKIFISYVRLSRRKTIVARHSGATATVVSLYGNKLPRNAYIAPLKKQCFPVIHRECKK